MDRFIHYGDNYYGLEDTREIFYSFTADRYETYNGHRYPHLDRKTNYLNLLEDGDLKQDVDQLKQLKKKLTDQKIKQLEENIKVVDCNRLETLKENTDYVITHLKETEYRGKKRYLFKIKEDPQNIYVSNYFFEKEMETKGHTDILIHFKTNKEKNNISRKKEMDVIL